MSENQSFPIWQKLLFSPFVLKQKRTRKIAYIAIMVALAIVCNMYFEFKLGAVQYSFTTAISALIGLLIGPTAGLIACFIGDAVGFMVNPFGAYTPWIGLATGLIAFISGCVFHLFKTDKKWAVYVKLGIIAVLTFFICSIGINSTFLWLAYYNNTGYFAYLVNRYIVLGQLLVSVINYALLFIFVPLIGKISFFKDLNI